MCWSTTCARRRWRGCSSAMTWFPRSNRAVFSPAVSVSARAAPYAQNPAYDDLIQGATALPALMAQTSDGVPRYVPNALVDRIVGLTAVGAICASLVHRDRTGRGQRLDIPMFETMAGFVMGDHMGGLTYQPPLDKGGYARDLSRERRACKTSDGYICVIVYNDKQWENFFEATGRDDLRKDPRFATFAGRAVNIDMVYAE